MIMFLFCSDSYPPRDSHFTTHSPLQSYTMMGSGKGASRGLIPRLCEELFARIQASTTTGWTAKVEVSYMEIYLEKVRDLLTPTSQRPLRVRQHATMGPYVEDLTSHAVDGFEMVQGLMDEGAKVRLQPPACYLPS